MATHVSESIILSPLLIVEFSSAGIKTSSPPVLRSQPIILGPESRPSSRRSPRLIESITLPGLQVRNSAKSRTSTSSGLVVVGH